MVSSILPKNERNNSTWSIIVLLGWSFSFFFFWRIWGYHKDISKLTVVVIKRMVDFCWTVPKHTTIVLHIIICTAPIHFRNYSSFPKLLHIFVDVTPCYGQELPVVDSATGLEYNCGIYGVECPRSSFCHQTASFAKCCPKGRKSWNSFFASCEILLFL